MTKTPDEKRVEWVRSQHELWELTEYGILNQFCRGCSGLEVYGVDVGAWPCVFLSGMEAAAK